MPEPSFKLGPLQQKWLDALKSGRYRHCKGQLGRVALGEQKNCCLGVLCEVLKIELFQMGYDIIYANMVAYAPDVATKSVGLRDSSGRIYGKMDSLSTINDQSDSYAPVIEILETRPGDVFTKPK